MREIYLDNCATTKPRREVVEEMVKCLNEDFGNPSSLHSKGFLAEKKLQGSRKTLAEYLGVRDEEIYFTSGGTEGNNLAVQGIINSYKNKGRHIITSKIEHSSILNLFREYEERGYDVSYLDVDSEGFISIEDLKRSLREDTILLSLIHVNNEIGSLQNMDRINQIFREVGIYPKVHLDIVQSFGKVDLDLKRWKVDSAAISGHKIYGPKGVGALYLDRDLKIKSLVFGGNQENGLRSGTENLPGIVGMAKAVDILKNTYRSEADYVAELREYTVEKLGQSIDGIKINTRLSRETSPYILNISFSNIKGEILLHYLEKDGIYVSTGSACSKGTVKSQTLEAIGLSDAEIDGAIRICFSFETSKEDIDIFIEKTRQAVEEIREITMR